MALAGFKSIGVVGAGQMGSGIAQIAALAGLNVTLVDVKAEQLATAEKTIGAFLDKMVAKTTLTAAARTEAWGRLAWGEGIQHLKSVDVVIEAVIENEEIKGDLVASLDALLGPQAIIASNTSSIPITRLASRTKRPAQFIGMHFMNPVPIMKLVEIIPGMATSDQTTKAILALAKALGKETVTSQDYPGFIVNRILMPMINEAFNVLLEGVASAEDIDQGMKLGTNQPMGPLALADFIGLDTCLYILKVMHSGLGDPRYRPSPLLAKYVDAGFMGRKCKRGVYQY